MGYRLLMLGPPTLSRDSVAVPIKSQKGQALLWYLAAQPTLGFSREHLHGVLWDDIPSDAARRNFNTMMSRLRSQLPAECIRDVGGQLTWNVASGVRVDVIDFLRCTAGNTSGPHPVVPPVSETPEQKEALYEAIALWRGPFLEGFSCDSALYEDWIAAERQRWESRILAVLTALVGAEKRDGRWAQVAALGQRALHIDPLQEPFHRAIMEALLHDGNRSGALAQYESCRRILDEQLGAEPDGMTVALFESIKSSATTPRDSQSDKTGQSATRPRLGGPPAPLHGDAPSPRRVVPQYVRSIAASMPPLIGRDREYARITEVLKRSVGAGGNHLVLLQGEAGVGKTRLLSEIVADAAGDKPTGAKFATVLVGRAYESMLDVPYAALADALAPAVAEIDWRGFALPDLWLRELGRLLPEVFIQLRDLEPPLPTDSVDDRLRFYQSVSAFLAALPQPVLLSLDDLQWSDGLTVSLMAYLLRRQETNPNLAVLGAIRSGEQSNDLQLALGNLKREGRLTRLELSNLTQDDTFALVRSLVPDQAPEQAAQVYSHSQGHPLYIVELTNMLAESDDTSDDGSSSFPIPTTVQDVFFGRLHRLGEPSVQVAEALALFRRGATADALQQATGHPDTYVMHALDRLIRGRIVDEDGRGTIAYRHDIFRRVVLERMTPARLTYLHRRAYAVLTTALPPGAVAPANLPETPETSARAAATVGTAKAAGTFVENPDQQLLADLVAHSVAGQLWEEALGRAQQAAEAAERVYAFPVAVEYLHTALTCLDKLPVTEATIAQRLDIDIQISKLDSWSPPDERDARLQAAAYRAQQHGALSYMPRLRMAQAESLILQGRCREAAALLEQLAPLATRDPRLALGLHAWRGAIATVVGDVGPAIEHLLHVREAAGRQVLKPGTSVYGGLAACFATIGDFAKADEALAAMEREEKEQGFQTLTSKYLVVAATVAWLRGRWAEAERFARQSLPAARTAEDPANEALSFLWIGASLLEFPATAADETSVVRALGPVQTGPGSVRSDTTIAGAEFVQEAIRMLHGALEASERAQTFTRRDFIYAFLAFAYARADRHDDADAALREGLRIAERFGFKEGKALCTEYEGRIAALRGDGQAALRRWQTALGQFQALGNTVGVHRCRRRLHDSGGASSGDLGGAPARAPGGSSG